MRFVLKNVGLGKHKISKSIDVESLPFNITPEEFLLMEANVHIGKGDLELVPTDGFDGPEARQFVIVHNGLRGVGTAIIV